MWRICPEEFTWFDQRTQHWWSNKTSIRSISAEKWVRKKIKKKKRSADWSNFVRPFMLSFSATFQCSLCIQQLLCASLIEWKPVSLLNLLFIFCYPFTCLVGTLAGLSAVPLVQCDIICDNHVTTSSLFLAWDRKKNRVSFGSCRTHQ